MKERITRCRSFPAVMKYILPLVMALLGLAYAAERPQTYDSFKPGELWLDNKGVHINAHGGGICRYKGVYYWFGEHKVEGTKGNSAQVGVHVYASKDLYNWKDMGIALEVSDDPQSPIARGCILERPKVVYCRKTKKFVMWFHLELKGQGYNAAQSGVAVASKITGPYKFVRSGRVNPGKWPMNLPADQRRTDIGGPLPQLAGSFYKEGDDKLAFLRRDFEKGQMARDMTIFVDDDGKAYHIYSSEGNSTLHIAELTDDYTKHTGRYVRLFEGRFMEAPAICKKNGKYYLIMSGCTGWWPNAARSAVASRIFGPWEELGNPCVGEKAGSTFGGQSTYIVAVPGKKDEFIFMADQWRPDNAIDGRYLWLPIKFHNGKMEIRNEAEWKY